MKIQKVIKNGDLWVWVIDDDGMIVHKELLTKFGAEPVQPDFELPPIEEKRKLSKRGKFTIAAIAGGALVAAVIVVKCHNRHERA